MSERVAITGATGLIGSALVPHLTGSGYVVSRISRHPTRDGDVAWNPDRNELDPRPLEGLHAVVHLAGEPIGHRWTRARKERIVTSRVRGTTVLARTLEDLTAPPRVVISASAVGYYGDRGDEILTEHSPRGNDFLADVAAEWESAMAPLRARGVRVVQARFGIILSTRGGALGRMLLPFRLGLGGRLGSGRQWMSWIAIDDLVAAVAYLLREPSIEGPANLVAPNPVTNAEFTRTLARVLRRPAFFAVPPAALRLVFLEMADATLLASQRVHPEVLAASGFTWRYPALGGALEALLRS